LNTLLTEALANVAPNDRIILDTGDGAALSFIGDPEDALFVSLSLREALQMPQPPGPELRIRLGINLGPVRLVKDINGQPNIIGDGINVAQRVMGFSHPGQILVSRSFYEWCRPVRRIRKLFHYEGSRTDKHVREHEIYTVQATTASLQRSTAARPGDAQTGSGAVVLDRLTQTAAVVTDNLRRKPRLGTGVAVVAILSVAVGLRLARQPAAAPVPTPSPPPTKVARAPATTPNQPLLRGSPTRPPRPCGARLRQANARSTGTVASAPRPRRSVSRSHRGAKSTSTARCTAFRPRCAPWISPRAGTGSKSGTPVSRPISRSWTPDPGVGLELGTSSRTEGAWHCRDGRGWQGLS
jgi:hypothetical protein